jgi:hypothetical protein
MFGHRIRENQMKKLVACALLGFGLTQVLVGCGDDDDAVDGGSGSSGTATGGTASGGKGSGGSATTAGSSTGGKATGGSNATAGSAGKGGTATGGTATGGTGNAGGEAGAGGENLGGGDGVGGAAGGEGGAGGAGPVEPDPEPQVASSYWLSKFCDAKSMELLMCESSPEWDTCFTTYKPFLSTDVQGECVDDDAEVTKLIAMVEALDKLAAACPSPDVDDWRCTFDGAPQAKDQACRDADEARRVAAMNCGL